MKDIRIRFQQSNLYKNTELYVAHYPSNKSESANLAQQDIPFFWQAPSGKVFVLLT
jgi:hypothetical protein